MPDHANAARHGGAATAATTGRGRWLALVGVVGVALMLRAPVSNVPPALATIAADLSLPPAVAGLATTLPLVCFGVFAFLAPPVSARVGPITTMSLATVVLCAGLAVRSVPTAATFFLGVTLVGVAIAVGNVIAPAVVRADFPQRVALMMAVYSLGLQVSAGAGAATTGPLLFGLGWEWMAAIGVWLAPALAVAGVWGVLAVRSRRADTGTLPPPTTLRRVARNPLTWGIAVFFGLQSLTFYSLLTWLPAQLTAHGVSASTAGTLLATFSMLGVPGSFLGPAIIDGRHGTVGLVAVFAAFLTGVLLLIVGPAAAVVGTLMCGLSQGVALAVALSLVAHQSDPADVPAASAIAQGTGYTLAAVGPVLVGGLFSVTGGWVVPDLVLSGGIIGAATAAVWSLRMRRRG